MCVEGFSMIVPPHKCDSDFFPAREPLEFTLTGEAKGRPWRKYEQLLRQAGLRPTRPRMILCWILFSNGDRHVTAERLYDDVVAAKIPISLATVYNTLKQFTEAGLLRQIGVDGSKSFFDTNSSDHHHFFIQGEDSLLDIPVTEDLLDKIPEPPEGFEIARVDVVVRLRRK